MGHCGKKVEAKLYTKCARVFVATGIESIRDKESTKEQAGSAGAAWSRGSLPDAV